MPNPEDWPAGSLELELGSALDTLEGTVLDIIVRRKLQVYRLVALLQRGGAVVSRWWRVGKEERRGERISQPLVIAPLSSGS